MLLIHDTGLIKCIVSITLYYMQINIYVTDPRYGFNQMYCFYNIISYGNEYSGSITLYYMQMNIYVTVLRYRFNRI